MFIKVSELGRGVCKAEAGDLWGELLPRIGAVLAAFYEEPTPLGFYPHFNEVALRMTLLGAVPELDAARKQLQELMKSGAGAVVVDQLHLAGHPPAVRNRLLYALCLALGYPTPSSQRLATLLWDVKARAVTEKRAATYSEHAEEADLHTDSQAYPMPEPYFALYTVQAARCGGGVSLFLSAEAIREGLAAGPGGKEALELLSTTPLPFFIPLAESTARAGESVSLAPIFSAAPAIRFRRDVLEEGLRARPDIATREVRAAFDGLLDVLARGEGLVRYALPDDGVVFCDNHAMLHGRTRFTDGERHLLRVRMSAEPVAVSITKLLQQHQQFFAKAVLR